MYLTPGRENVVNKTNRKSTKNTPKKIKNTPKADIFNTVNGTFLILKIL